MSWPASSRQLPFVTAAIKQFRVNWPSPIWKPQPINSSPIFDAVDFGWWREAITHPLLGQPKQSAPADVLPTSQAI
jgi:hypothetical protein